MVFLKNISVDTLRKGNNEDDDDNNINNNNDNNRHKRVEISNKEVKVY
jgi:hypothetical protein